MTLISIITVTYNAEKTIQRCLESVRSQKIGRHLYEHIVIDGGSKDTTTTIIASFQNNLDYFISEADDGISDAFNKGLKIARGKYVLFLSSDDFFADYTVLDSVSVYLESDADVYVGGIIKISPNNTRIQVLPPKDYNSLLFDMTINHPAMFAKRTVLNEVDGFDVKLKLAMDYKQCLLLYLQNYTFNTLPITVTVVSELGVSHINYIASRKELKKIQIELLGAKHAVKNYIFALYRYYLRRSLEKLGMDFLVNYYRKKFSANKKELI